MLKSNQMFGKSSGDTPDFFIFNKIILKFRNVLENHLKSIRLIFFVHVGLYFVEIKIVCSFFKLSYYNLYIIHASQKGGGDCHTNLNFSFSIIYIIVPLYRRKFFDGYIILVLYGTFSCQTFNKNLKNNNNSESFTFLFINLN